MQDTARVNTPIRSVINGLLHASAKQSDREIGRHTIFVAVHLAIGVVAIAALPLIVLLARAENSAVSITSSLLALWMLAPLLSVAYLSKTGNLGTAFLLSASLAAGFIAWIATMTGGLHSPHLVWLAIIPLEVAIAGSVKLIKRALGICFAVLGGLGIAHAVGYPDMLALEEHGASLVGSLSIIAAICYTGALAVRIEWLHNSRLDEVASEEMRYRSLADTVSDMITRHDRSGDVTFASPAARLLFDAPSETLYRNGLFHHIHIPDRPAYLHALSACMNDTSEEGKPVTVELRVMSKRPGIGSDNAALTEAGTLRWVEMKCAPERDESGSVTGAIVATRDISKRKQQQFDLEDAREEAERANESKTRFLANVTHELRTPLNTIIGFSEILRHPDLIGQSEERNLEYAELINKGGNHLLQLVNDLLDMSRIESGNFEVSPQHFDMSDLTQSCCQMMQADADQRKITLFSQCDKTLEDMNADPRACRQILLNVISNALKFSDEGDQVSVALGWAKDHKGRKCNDRIAVTVTDTGIGIGEKDIPKLGQPFVQAESGLQRRYEGAGIGLSIVQGLTQLQHGSMKIESKLGKGTKVTICLPIDITTAERVEQTPEEDAVVKLGQTETMPDNQTGKVASNKVA